MRTLRIPCCAPQRLLILLFAMGLLSIASAKTAPWPGPSVDFSHGPLRVSRNHRFLVHADGTPFFYLADTAWELIHRLNRSQTVRYLEDRRAKGFTVIQTVILAEYDGLHQPNAEGQTPLLHDDPEHPNEAYFRHVDFVLEQARRNGLYIGLLPTWGDKVDKMWGMGPVVFTPANAYAYGLFLGRRYRRAPNLIWILGGDRPAGKTLAVWNAMARGLRDGDGGAHLITYHPMGGHSSSEWFQSSAWLDFNLLQSSHGAKNFRNDRMIAADYAKTPIKPVIDGEQRYEDHPVNWKPELGWFDAFDVRQAAYWAVFAGAAGDTYGCNDIWQMNEPGYAPINHARLTWEQALNLPGAGQMQYLRRLMESRPYLARVPDQSLIAAGQSDGIAHIQATRGDGYAFLYLPRNASVTVAMGKIPSRQVTAWWFNPRSGEARRIGSITNRGTHVFHTPGRVARGNDWVLVLDDASRHFPAPGNRVAGRTSPAEGRH